MAGIIVRICKNLMAITAALRPCAHRDRGLILLFFLFLLFLFQLLLQLHGLIPKTVLLHLQIEGSGPIALEIWPFCVYMIGRSRLHTQHKQVIGKNCHESKKGSIDTVHGNEGRALGQCYEESNNKSNKRAIVEGNGISIDKRAISQNHCKVVIGHLVYICKWKAASILFK